MDIRALTPTYAVSPQIDPSDLPAIKAAGYTTVIDNRPDGEIPPDLHTEVMRAAAEALGLVFIANPIIPGQLGPSQVAMQAPQWRRPVARSLPIAPAATAVRSFGP